MCDQTEVAYNPKDIVWVKLSNVWWPAEVQDESELDEDITAGLKKKPLAIVKFFNEDLYEFPKNLNQIYRYNCLRKDEFIKKGLDQLRADETKNITSSMKKFPVDVQIAQEKTGGNPDYIDDPKFLPEEKIDYRAEFGMKPLKRSRTRHSDSFIPSSPRESSTPSTTKVSFHLPGEPSSSKSKLQSTPKNQSIISTPTSILKKGSKQKSKREPVCSYYPCVHCNKTLRGTSDIAVYHMQTHFRGIILPPPKYMLSKYIAEYRKNRNNYYATLEKKNQKNDQNIDPGPDEKVTNKRKILHDTTSPNKKQRNDQVNNTTSVSSLPSMEDTDASHSRDSDSLSRKRVKKQKTSKENKIQSAALEILKDWDEESNVGDSDMASPVLEDENSITVEDASNTEKLESNKITEKCETTEPSSSTSVAPSPVKTLEKSCFDFEDNEDSLNLDQSLKFGQKLPRVINEKQSTAGRFKPDLKPECSGDDFSKDVESFLESAHVPSLPEIPSLEKCSPLKVEQKNEENIVIENVKDQSPQSTSLHETGIEIQVSGFSKENKEKSGSIDKSIFSNKEGKIEHPVNTVDTGLRSKENNSDEQNVNLVDRSRGDKSSNKTQSSVEDFPSLAETCKDRNKSVECETSPAKGKSEGNLLNLDLSEETLNNKTVCHSPKTDKKLTLPYSEVVQKSNEISNFLLPGTSLQETLIAFSDEDLTEKSLYAVELPNQETRTNNNIFQQLLDNNDDKISERIDDDDADKMSLEEVIHVSTDVIETSNLESSSEMVGEKIDVEKIIIEGIVAHEADFINDSPGLKLLQQDAIKSHLNKTEVPGLSSDILSQNRNNDINHESNEESLSSDKTRVVPEKFKSGNETEQKPLSMKSDNDIKLSKEKRKSQRTIKQVQAKSGSCVVEDTGSSLEKGDLPEDVPETPKSGKPIKSRKIENSESVKIKDSYAKKDKEKTSFAKQKDLKEGKSKDVLKTHDINVADIPLPPEAYPRKEEASFTNSVKKEESHDKMRESNVPLVLKDNSSTRIKISPGRSLKNKTEKHVLNEPSNDKKNESLRKVLAPSDKLESAVASKPGVTPVETQTLFSSLFPDVPTRYCISVACEGEKFYVPPGKKLKYNKVFPLPNCSSPFNQLFQSHERNPFPSNTATRPGTSSAQLPVSAASGSNTATRPGTSSAQLPVSKPESNPRTIKTRLPTPRQNVFITKGSVPAPIGTMRLTQPGNTIKLHNKPQLILASKPGMSGLPPGITKGIPAAKNIYGQMKVAPGRGVSPSQSSSKLSAMKASSLLLVKHSTPSHISPDEDRKPTVGKRENPGKPISINKKKNFNFNDGKTFPVKIKQSPIILQRSSKRTLKALEASNTRIPTSISSQVGAAAVDNSTNIRENIVFPTGENQLETNISSDKIIFENSRSNLYQTQASNKTCIPSSISPQSQVVVVAVENLTNIQENVIFPIGEGQLETNISSVKVISENNRSNLYQTQASSKTHIPTSISPQSQVVVVAVENLANIQENVVFPAGEDQLETNISSDKIISENRYNCQPAPAADMNLSDSSAANASYLMTFNKNSKTFINLESSSVSDPGEYRLVSQDILAEALANTVLSDISEVVLPLNEAPTTTTTPRTVEMAHPSMPLLTDEGELIMPTIIYSDATVGESGLSYAMAGDEIVLSSASTPPPATSNYIPFSATVLPTQETNITNVEDNVLPRFLTPPKKSPKLLKKKNFNR